MSNPSLSCIVVGRGAIARHGVQRLRERGWLVRGLLPCEPDAAAHDSVPLLANRNALRDVLRREPTDYLFGLGHPGLLDSELLALSQRGAVCMHDALRPEFSGLCSATRVLQRGEPQHGVTFYAIGPEPAAPTVLKQARLDVHPEDTVHTLSARTADLAVTCFDSLIEQLAEREVAPLTPAPWSAAMGQPAGDAAWLAHLDELAARLQSVAPWTHPFLETGGAREVEAQRSARGPTLVVPIAVDAPHTAELVAALFAYAHRLHGESAVDLGWLKTAPMLSSTPFCMPLRLGVAPDQGDLTIGELIARAAMEVDRMRSFAADPRHALERSARLQGTTYPNFPVCITELESASATPEWPERDAPALLVCAHRDGSAAQLRSRGLREPRLGAAIAEHLRCILEAARANPHTPLRALPLMSEPDRVQFARGGRPPQAWTPCEHSVVALFAEQAAKTPDALALRHGTTSLSYRALDARTNQLARCLLERGVAAGDLVAFCLPRGVEQLVCMLAIAKLGAAYVPIDPAYPQERIRYIVEDSGAVCLLTTSALRSALSLTAIPSLCLDEEQVALAARSAQALDRRVDPASCLYVIYTSGTTGKPKGVMISHASLINHSWAVADVYSLSESDRLLQSAPVSFDVAQEQIWPALLRGAAVVVRPDDLLESFERFARFAEAERLTALVLPTAFWHEWISELEATDTMVPDTIRCVSVGTEKALGSRLERWRKRCRQPVRFVHGYGPTETTVTCSMFVVQPDEPIPQDGELPIGSALPNVELYVVDRYGEPLPSDLPGELWIGGHGVALGYLRRPELTAERFIPHPFREGARVYRSGDRVRQRPDGNLLFQGRDDGQIKVRGHRIELGEVEAVLCAHPAVATAVAHVVPDGENNRLVAYIVPAANAGSEARGSAREPTIDIERLREHLTGLLPGYMVPSAFVSLSVLPRTPNGKIDRKALPVPDLKAGRSRRNRTPPRDELELRLATLFEDILQLDGVDVNDSFFDMGGHSLLAVRLTRNIRESLGVELSLGALFKQPSVAALAAHLRGSGSAISESCLLPLQKGNGLPPLYFICGVSLYRSLAQALDPAQPSYGIYLEQEEAILSADVAGGDMVAQMAAGYVEAIMKHHPSGPCSLLGVSFGGVLAYEVARRLRAAGREVALLVLVDPIVRSSFEFNPTYYVASRLRSALRSGTDRVRQWATQKWANRSAPAMPTAQPDAQHASADETAAGRRGRTYAEAARAFDRKQHGYAGRTVLIRAGDHTVSHRQLRSDLGWSRRIHGTLRIFQSPGDHLGVLREGATATILRHELALAYAELTPQPTQQ